MISVILMIGNSITKMYCESYPRAYYILRCPHAKVIHVHTIIETIIKPTLLSIGES